MEEKSDTRESDSQAAVDRQAQCAGRRLAKGHVRRDGTAQAVQDKEGRSEQDRRQAVSLFRLASPPAVQTEYF